MEAGSRRAKASYGPDADGQIGEEATEAVEGDFISDAFSYFSAGEDERSPEIFRIWTSLSMMAGALERRVTVKTGRWRTHMNLYVFLVGGPGAGKSIIDSGEALARDVLLPGTKTRAFHMAPTSTTKASLVDAMEKAQRQVLLKSGQTMTYSSLYSCAEEFGALQAKHDLEYISFLNVLYMNKPWYEERRRVGERHVLIESPTFNFLAGIQPAIMGSIFPEEHWTSGLARRVMMVYSDEDRVIDPFGDLAASPVGRQSLLDRLGKFMDFQGEVTWSPEAEQLYTRWNLGGQEPKPTHSKLVGYVRERVRNLSKLAGLSAISRTSDPNALILPLDFNRAMAWMFDAERRMPDIFRAMLGKSDNALVEELWLYVSRRYMESKGAGVSDSDLARFVGERTTIEKVDKIIALAERMHKIRKKPLSEKWEPTGKSDHVPE